MRRVSIVAGVVLVFALVACSSAFAKDRTIIARNILPSGQYQVPGPGAAAQAQMYNALTPLFDQVTPNDLFTDFKSEKLSIDTDGPTTQENVPFPGVTLLRDRFDIPHIYASTRQGGILTDGWIAAEDRGLLLQQARYDSRIAVIDAPGLSAISLISSLQNFVPSAQTEAFTASETKALKRQGKEGKEGKAVLRDIDTYVAGINAYLAASHSPNAPWTRNDIYASTPSRASSSARAAAARRSTLSSWGVWSSSSAGAGVSRPSTTCASSRTRRASPQSTAASRMDTSRRSTRAASYSTTTASLPPQRFPRASPASSMPSRSRPATS
jgi:hypothetical protein